MFLSMGQCVEFMTWQRRLRVNGTIRGHGFYTLIRVCSISPEPLDRVSINITKMFVLVRPYAESMNQQTRLKVKVTSQCHGIYTSVSC